MNTPSSCARSTACIANSVEKTEEIIHLARTNQISCHLLHTHLITMTCSKKTDQSDFFQAQEHYISPVLEALLLTGGNNQPTTAKKFASRVHYAGQTVTLPRQNNDGRL